MNQKLWFFIKNLVFINKTKPVTDLRSYQRKMQGLQRHSVELPLPPFFFLDPGFP